MCLPRKYLRVLLCLIFLGANFGVQSADSNPAAASGVNAAGGNVAELQATASLVRGPYLQMQTDDGISIHWRTDTQTDSVVRYGTSPGNLSNSVTVSGSYVDHVVELSGLGANQHYWYSVGDSAATIAGDDSFHFYTAPVQGLAADTRIWVVGDSGTADANARNVRNAYKAWSGSEPANLWLMLGDNAYTNGTDSEYQAAVFDTYPEILRQLPLWATLGNHDGHSADSGTQSGPYYDIFNFPTNGEINILHNGGINELVSGTEAYYSFDYANIHFICLDSYDTNRAANGAMMTWLQNDLALNTQPWVIAFWHHPPYTKGSHNSDSESQLIDMRQNALPILEQFGVDLVMTGHSHSYERSYLLDGHYGNSTSLDPDNNVLNPGDGKETGDGVYEKPDVIAAYHEGAVYAVAGSSGKISGGSLNHPAMFVSLNSLGSLVVDVSGNRMDVVFLNQNGAELDEFSIVKTPDFEPPLISSASTGDATHLFVNFDEPLDFLEATTLSNYSIAGLSIDQVELLPGDVSVRLTTSTMTPDFGYTLVVNNVQDLHGNTILPDSQINFSFFEVMTLAFQDGLKPDTGYDGTFDGYIREASANTAHGLEPSLQVDGSEPSGSATDMNIVLGWDISTIPTDAIVEAADIQLEVTNWSSGSYTCYGLLTAWDQSEVTWNIASTGAPWGAPGAASASDRSSEVLCTVSAGAVGPLTVNLTAAGLAQVQSWVSDPSSNHGMIIADPATGDGADFHSSESGTAMARPKLNVTYRVSADPGNVDPVAGFSSSCTDLDCNFSDSSSDSDGSIALWAWDFGDGASSAAPNPGHSYAAAGDFTVVLTVTDNEGASDTSSQVVNITAPPTSDVITLIDAVYKAGRDEFKVRATSSEQPDVTMEVLGFGPMKFNKSKYEYKLRPTNGITIPSTVDIVSSGGGVLTVTVVGAPPPPVPGKANAPSPANGVSDVPLSVLLDWSAGSNTDTHTVYFGTSNPPSGGASQSTTDFDPGPLANDTTYYWRIDESNAFGTTTGDTWSFTTVGAPQAPGAASNPAPNDGAVDVDINADLGWNAGSQAESHSVYFGDSTGLTLVSANQSGTSFEPGELSELTTYYWRVDESNALGTTAGPSWSFTTRSAVPADTITITKAEWKASRLELKVEATSSGAPAAVLTVEGFGQMTYDARKNKYKFAVKPVGSNPGTVTVTSSLGGSATLAVRPR